VTQRGDTLTERGAWPPVRAVMKAGPWYSRCHPGKLLACRRRRPRSFGGKARRATLSAVSSQLQQLGRERRGESRYKLPRAARLDASRAARPRTRCPRLRFRVTRLRVRTRGTPSSCPRLTLWAGRQGIALAARRAACLSTDGELPSTRDEGDSTRDEGRSTGVESASMVDRLIVLVWRVALDWR
jgi:hypothetical protein